MKEMSFLNMNSLVKSDIMIIYPLWFPHMDGFDVSSNYQLLSLWKYWHSNTHTGEDMCYILLCLLLPCIDKIVVVLRLFMLADKIVIVGQ